MTRKDTILIAVVINAGLLAILFATAIIYDTEKLDEPQVEATIVVAQESYPDVSIIASNSVDGDEVDNVLKYYSQPSNQPLAIEPQMEAYSAPEPDVTSHHTFEKESMPANSTLSKDEFVEVTVKKGDSLDKIARANGTTVNAIKKASQLENEKLSIGQVLKVPVKKEKPAKPAVKPVATPEVAAADAVYYTLKSGDNPWKIAKQFNVSAEDIVRLNSLDEAKARNLKAGDRIRVK
jgi:peptidoglycan endopeptidase LytF